MGVRTMSSALDYVRYSCGIAGEEVANYVDELEEQISKDSALIDQLRDELEKCQKDAERLTWLLDHPDAVICNDGPEGPFHIWFRYSNRVAHRAQTKRQAIDAAIAAQKEKA